YYLQVIPALCWIATHPRGILTRWFSRAAWPRGARSIAWTAILPLACATALLPAAIHDGATIAIFQGERAGIPGYKHEAMAIGKLIQEKTKKTDTIWVWGRWAWPIYYYADRLSATRFYKVLGLITNELDNTWLKRTSQTRFNGKGPHQEI